MLSTDEETMNTNTEENTMKVNEQGNKAKKVRFRRTKRLNPVTQSFVATHKENISLIRSLCNFNKEPKPDNTDDIPKKTEIISETQKQERMKSAKKIIQLGIFIPFALFIYTIYLLIHLNFASFLIAFILTINASLYVLSEALILHQLKHNLSGCSFSNYFKHLLTKVTKR